MSSATPMRPRVALPDSPGPLPPIADRLHEDGCEILLYAPGDRESARRVLHETDIFVATPSQRFVVDAELLSGAPRLRAVNSLVIGVETIDVAACTAAGIIVGNGAVLENVIGVAEATVMLMLALNLEVKRKERAVRDGAWRIQGSRSKLLRGATVGLIGLGRIGRAVAARLEGWDTHILGYDPYVSGAVAPSGVELVRDLDNLLRRSDVVSVHVALTPETRGLLGRRELNVMRPGALLVNTARGGVIDENALADAIAREHIGGAAIDAWSEEPTAPDNPLLGVDPDRTILTGHCIAHSARLPDDIVEAAVETIRRESRGELPVYPVNPSAEPAWRARLAALASVAAGRPVD